MSLTTLTTILTPVEIVHLPETDLSAATAVVFDILRATTTITTALEHGAAAIYPAKDIAEAWEIKKIHPQALLGGERHGEKIEGFDLGNSPLEYRDLAGREIISTTTNGTLALRAVAHAQCVIAGSLRNIRAIADLLMHQSPEHLWLVCAGTGADFAIEDALGAGALLATLLQIRPTAIRLDDASKLLLELWKTQSSGIYELLASSKNGLRLIERGRAAEVAWCAQLDQCRVVGILENGAIRPHDLHLDS